jgi:flagellar capping protein FliD
MSISGVVSGIDWDSMVAKLLEQAKKPAYVMVDKRDRLELKKNLFEEFLVSLRSMQSTLTPLKLAATFKAKAVEINRVDSSASYKGVLSATVSSDAAINVYVLVVLQSAKAQMNRSKQITGALSTTGISAANSYFYVSAGGQKVRIDADPADDLATLADKINTTLKTQSPVVQVTATVVDGRLILKSDSTGLGSTEVTQDITRAVSGNDTLSFNVNPNNGKVTIKVGSTTYQQGKDFDIVGGNQVRWRTSDPSFPPPGAAYQDEYTAYAGDTFVMTSTRSASGDVDKYALGFAPSDTAAVTIEANGITYTRGGGGDFEIGADGSIYWLKPYRQPAAGASYEITYVAGGGEKVTLDITRGSQDESNINFADFKPGTAVVESLPPGQTWREGADFEVVQGASGKAVIQWYPGGNGTSPDSGDSYTFNYQKPDGTPGTDSLTRNGKDTVSLPGGGKFTTTPQGTHTVTYNGMTFQNIVPSPTTPAFTPTLDATGTALEITWANPISTTQTGTPLSPASAPSGGTSYTVTYTYDTNIFTLSDDGNGFLSALELDLTDDMHYTAAQDAVMILDGERVTRSSNRIGESYDNELIKGMTIDLKGVGRVSLDVSQDAEQAVTSLQKFIDEYNAILEWINVRMTEKELDENTKATIDSDDFRMKWGLLKGNSLLRDTKNRMRSLTSQSYIVSVASKTSRNAVYGPMSLNGIVNPGSFSVSVTGAAGTVYVNIPVEPGDTLQTIADKINGNTLEGRPNPLRFDADGNALASPLAKATLSGGKLTITGNNNSPVTLGGSSNVLKAMQLDQQYTALSQIGIKLPSSGATVTEDALLGLLEFDTSALMKALETNPDDVASLVTSFANRMQAYMDDMVKSSQKELAGGITSAQGAVVREMNSIDTEIASIDKYLKDFQRRLDDKQQALQRQFSAAEVNLSKLIQQADWLSSVTSQLQQSASGSR